MDDLTAALTDFDSYLDHLLQGKKELQIDVKSLSKISKLGKQLGSQSAIAGHVEMGRNLFVPDLSGRLQLSGFGTQTELLQGGQQFSTTALLAVAKEVFQDLAVTTRSPRTWSLPRTKCSPCCTTLPKSQPRSTSSCGSSKACSERNAP